MRHRYAIDIRSLDSVTLEVLTRNRVWLVHEQAHRSSSLPVDLVVEGVLTTYFIPDCDSENQECEFEFSFEDTTTQARIDPRNPYSPFEGKFREVRFHYNPKTGKSHGPWGEKWRFIPNLQHCGSKEDVLAEYKKIQEAEAARGKLKKLLYVLTKSVDELPQDLVLSMCEELGLTQS